MNFFQSRQKVFHLLISLIALCSIAVLIYILALPGDPKNAWFLGLSRPRWLMTTGAFLLCLLSISLVLKTILRPAWGQHAADVWSRWLYSKVGLALTFSFSIFWLLISVWFAMYWRHFATDQYMLPYLTRFAPFMGWFFGVSLLLILALPFFRRSLWQDYAALLVSVLLVFLVDQFTNILEIEQMPWDVRYFYLLAEHGLRGTNIAPYVYRFATPMLARWLADVLYLTIFQAYTIIAISGGILQLFGIHLLVRKLGFGLKTSIMIISVVGFTMFNLKFLLFDVSRPDHLAYILMLLAVLALFSQQTVWCVLVAVIGLQFRELLAVPPAILSLTYFRDWLRNRANMKLWLHIALIGIATALAVILPRKLIPVTENTQFVDLQVPSTLINLITLPADIWRDSNLLFVVVGYFLPTFVLLTPQRWRSVWHKLRPYHWFLALYMGLVFLLTLYGGHDMMRYITYMFIPQVFFLAYLLQEELHPLEIVYLFVVLIIFNRIFLPFPVLDFNANVDFYGGYAEQVDLASLYRWLEVLGMIIGSGILRMILNRLKRKIQ
ncbi:MAG: hypothetical protein WCG34_10900 [Leptolinea sp.]